MRTDKPRSKSRTQPLPSGTSTILKSIANRVTFGREQSISERVAKCKRPPLPRGAGLSLINAGLEHILGDD